MVKILIAIPACRYLNYSKWESEDSPYYDPNNNYKGKPYGKDFHITGPNNRLKAIRETWTRAINQENVHFKFFHGNPQTTSPADDEIYLNCEDDYEHLSDKVIALCRWAYENEYDWIFKAD